MSWEAEIGTIPVRGTSPTVGRSPTSLLAADGLMIEPDVSVPMVSAARPVEADTAEPDEEPDGVAVASLALRTWPPSEE